MDFKSGLVTVYSSKWISVGIEPFYWKQYCMNKLPVCTHNKLYMVWCSPPNLVAGADKMAAHPPTISRFISLIGWVGYIVLGNST